MLRPSVISPLGLSICLRMRGGRDCQLERQRGCLRRIPYVSPPIWANHQRVHQYNKGGHKETWGGVTDQHRTTNYVDGWLSAVPRPRRPPPPPPAGSVGFWGHRPAPSRRGRTARSRPPVGGDARARNPPPANGYGAQLLGDRHADDDARHLRSAAGAHRESDSPCLRGRRTESRWDAAPEARAGDRQRVHPERRVRPSTCRMLSRATSGSCHVVAPTQLMCSRPGSSRARSVWAGRRRPTSAPSRL